MSALQIHVSHEKYEILNSKYIKYPIDSNYIRIILRLMLDIVKYSSLNDTRLTDGEYSVNQIATESTFEWVALGNWLG